MASLTAPCLPRFAPFAGAGFGADSTFRGTAILSSPKAATAAIRGAVFFGVIVLKKDGY